MRSLEVIMLKNAEAAGREAAEAAELGEYHDIEKNNDEAVYGDVRLDRAARRALQDAYHEAFTRELGVRP